VVAHLVALASAGALLLSGQLWAAVAFGVLAGVSLGAITSLQGLYTKELIDPQHFGALFGALQGVIGIGGAAGPAIGGLVLDLGGSHRLLVAVMTVDLAVAVVVLATGPSRLAARGFTDYRRWTMIVDRARAEMFASWFRCLADPTRIQILSLLATERRPMAVGEIVAAMDVGQSTVSEHLRRLAETCFVHVEHRGTASLFLVNQGCIEALPSAAELVMGEVDAEALPAPRPGATSRGARLESRRRAVTT
jgi:MFS family permease